MDKDDLPLKKSLLILGHEVVGIVNQAGLRVPVDVFPFDELPDVLIKVKHGKNKRQCRNTDIGISLDDVSIMLTSCRKGGKYAAT